MGTYILAALLSLTLIGTAVAEGGGALSDRGKTALGMTLLSEEKMSISIWRVSPTKMWGFEVGAGRFSTGRRSYTDHNSEDTHFFVNPSLTFKQFRPLRHDIAPFWYQTIGVAVTYRERPEVIVRENPKEKSYAKILGEDFRRWSADAGVGFGVAWFPFKRVSLSLRQGIRLWVSRSSHDPPEQDLKNTRDVFLSFSPMRLLALIHF